ncbi:hypothetical protein MOBT1_003103 [Malassezia obtusa]|uniref:NFACT RNA-binding domain-containing protein n=1 Tax=Malassezia obtusa TaxID=76774 RepID=A0AAF0E4N7_9BASI|nr:hypothetical protein MOBT1_003103 [Malassezia obtusa]
MVLFFQSTAVDPPATIYMGRDKVENEELLQHGLPEVRRTLTQDVWFHVDKLSSAHVYLRLPESIPSWTEIPEPLLYDCAQLVKANSIEGTCIAAHPGNKKNHLTIIYTPHSNVKVRGVLTQKTGDMAVGAVSFFNDRTVKRFYVKERENAVVNRLNKTRVERKVDYEAERQERERALGRKKKEFANAQVLYSEEAIAEQHRLDERRARLKAAQGEGQGEGESDAEASDDSFM